LFELNFHIDTDRYTTSSKKSFVSKFTNLQ